MDVFLIPIVIHFAKTFWICADCINEIELG